MSKAKTSVNSTVGEIQVSRGRFIFACGEMLGVIAIDRDDLLVCLESDRKTIKRVNPMEVDSIECLPADR